VPKLAALPTLDTPLFKDGADCTDAIVRLLIWADSRPITAIQMEAKCNYFIANPGNEGDFNRNSLPRYFAFLTRIYQTHHLIKPALARLMALLDNKLSQ
jgi:hypothetical protein